MIEKIGNLEMEIRALIEIMNIALISATYEECKFKHAPYVGQTTLDKFEKLVKLYEGLLAQLKEENRILNESKP